MPRCEAGSSGSKSLPEGTLPLVRKKFFHRKSIMSLFHYVKHMSGRERIYHESEWRYHRTDGVIFQPDAPYNSGRHDALMKWKWLDLASIDLRAQRTGADIDFSTEVQGGMPVSVKVVKLTEHDIMRLRADMKVFIHIYIWLSVSQIERQHEIMTTNSIFYNPKGHGNDNCRSCFGCHHWIVDIHWTSF